MKRDTHWLTLRRFIAVTVAVTTLTGCQQTRGDISPVEPLGDEAAPIAVPFAPVAPEVWAERGRVVEQRQMPEVASAVSAQASQVVRAVYTSINGFTGEPTRVSGAFFLPRAEPPAGGWPVISLAHATTGTAMDCAPSLYPDFLGYDSLVKIMLREGYAVAMTDYQGLGEPGVHPYLEPRTAAFNVTDAVRAIREIYPITSTKWLAFGGSQGGHASWAANESNDYYGDGLQFVGSVALAPAVDFASAVEMAYNETLTPEMRPILPLVVTSLANTQPGFPLDHFLHGPALEYKDVLGGCGEDVQKLRLQIIPDFIKPDTRADVDMLENLLRRQALPQRPLTKPMLVINGQRDQTVLPGWVAHAIDRSCAMGGQIYHYSVVMGGHVKLVFDKRFVVDWVADRFKGLPAPSTCPRAP